MKWSKRQYGYGARSSIVDIGNPLILACPVVVKSIMRRDVGAGYIPALLHLFKQGMHVDAGIEAMGG